jgi:hypothetical protein
MSAKMSAARREAFFAALEATGNQTLAAERAEVSRSWVQLHRSTDPAFDAEVRVRIEVARARIARAEWVRERAPGGVGAAAEEVLVIRGRRPGGGLGRRVQVGRARRGSHADWTAATEARFLAVLTLTRNVRYAADKAGVGRSSAYARRKRWPGFAERWDEALWRGGPRLARRWVLRNLDPLGDWEPSLAPIPPMRVDEAIQAVRMARLSESDRRPFGLARPPELEKVEASIRAKLDLIDLARRNGWEPPSRAKATE